MTLDLTPFARRVHAAVTTNQCLDYAADVQVLIHEVERLQRGYDAIRDARENLRMKASIGRGIDYSQMREAGVAYRIADDIVGRFESVAR